MSGEANVLSGKEIKISGENGIEINVDATTYKSNEQFIALLKGIFIHLFVII